MPPLFDSGRLLEVKAEIERFLDEHPNALMFEGGEEIIDLPLSEHELTLEYGKLLMQAWDGNRSIVRRIEEVACQDEHQLGLFARKPGARETVVLNLCAGNPAAPVSRQAARRALRQGLMAHLRGQFPEWRLERVSNRSDREHSFSAWYTRGLARRGRAAWAFIGLDTSEPFAAADGALAYGLNWLDWLRQRNENYVFSGLKLFLPSHVIPLNALRVGQLDRALGIEIFAWSASSSTAPAAPGEFLNADTRLTPRRDPGDWMARHRGFLSDLFGDLLQKVSLVPGASANTLSFRVHGLEIARMEGNVAPRFFWGIEGEEQIYRQDRRQEFHDYLHLVLAKRDAKSKDASHEIYRLQPERWLESLIARDLSKMDPSLRPDPVYSQVPAFSGMDRGVVDILGISKTGRLAVIELKLHEDITLPLQGLDYWQRVKWLNDRGQFREFGYFPGLEISPAPPMLYLVSPAFRFHPANERIICCFDRSIEVIMVGLNQQWRDGVKVLFRRAGRL